MGKSANFYQLSQNASSSSLMKHGDNAGILLQIRP